MKYVLFTIIVLLTLSSNLFFLKDKYLVLVPFFTPSIKLYKLINVTIYILTMFAISLNYSKESKNIIISNILAEFIFGYSLIKGNTYLMLLTKIIQFTLSLSLNEKISKNKLSSNLLTPYIIWTFFLTLVSISIFFVNNS